MDRAQENYHVNFVDSESIKARDEICRTVLSRHGFLMQSHPLYKTFLSGVY